MIFMDDLREMDLTMAGIGNQAERTTTGMMVSARLSKPACWNSLSSRVGTSQRCCCETSNA